MMNEKLFEKAVKTTLTELCSMSREEFQVEMEKRKNSDFARIFSEANESSYDDYPSKINQGDLNSFRFESQLEKLLTEIVEKQFEKLLPIIVEKVLSRIEPRAYGS